MTVAVSAATADRELIELHAHRWRNNNLVARLWNKDPTVWADPPTAEIADRLGWLDAPIDSKTMLPSIMDIAAEAESLGITTIVLCGMGGSSLAPEVFSETLPGTGPAPRLRVIDSTHPRSVQAVADNTDPRTTWYIVASKSGTTLETLSLFRFFWKIASTVIDDPGSHFIAITDAGSQLESLASERGFRATFLADRSVGGRYSALTTFGLVPAGLIGADVERLLVSAERGVKACSEVVLLEENPGFVLGVAMAGRVLEGRNKAHFLNSEPLGSVGVWIEQLIAESTGKLGTGIVPVNGGHILDGSPDAVVISIGSNPSPLGDVTVTLENAYDVGELMFIFEFATAVAGEILKVNPFDQPDVESAKDLTRVAMGDLSTRRTAHAGSDDTEEWLDTLDSMGSRDTISYIAIQAYLDASDTTTVLLDDLARELSIRFGVYVTVGVGPRFLHSTGQLHKGGPLGGMFLQFVDTPDLVVDVPEADFTFNDLISAQSIGDRAALTAAGRSVHTLQLGEDTETRLRSMIDQTRSVHP